MAACEKCWLDAYRRSMDHPWKDQGQHYEDLLEERKSNPCYLVCPTKNPEHFSHRGCPDCPKEG